MMRWDIINEFARRRKCQTYLEIGVFRGECIEKVEIPTKVGVDPDPKAPVAYHCTSDEYFADCNQKYDLIFIDGLHNAHQVWKDINNALAHLNENGVIMLHDCRPKSEKMQRSDNKSHQDEEWTGDVWKAYYKSLNELDYLVYVIDTDYGCGIIDTSVKPTDKSLHSIDIDRLSYDDYKSIDEASKFNVTGGIL